MILYLIELVAWVLTGVYVLKSEKINRISYMLVWLALILNIFTKIVVQG